MSLSESGQIIQRLIDSGLNMETIGQGIGRNRSLVRQVGIGAKPGNNLRESLARLEERLAGIDPARRTAAARSRIVAPPERRTTRKGAPAKVRKATTHGGPNWGTSNIKTQAARNGARGLVKALHTAADKGQQVGVSVTFTKRVTVEEYSKGRRGRSGPGGTLDFKLGDAADVVEAMEDQGITFSDYVAQAALDQGYVSGVRRVGEVVWNMVSIELRTF